MDSVYVAGNFNTWNTHDNKYQFGSIKDDEQFLDINLPPGKYEYKLTRGDWSKVETTAEGKGIENRILNLTKDTAINIFITSWSDDFKTIPVVKKHTASSHVTIMNTAFAIPQLNRTRRIWLYLPKDYSAKNKKRFPVLYMHDGQNLFDEATAGFGEWGVDECLDSLFNQGKKECIVVGIDNGPKRMNEYNPYTFQSFGKGEGNQYVDFIAKTLKPYIDKHLHTLKDKKNTFVAGSSMGGLISLYAVMKYPNVFGGAGIFSPAFWTAPEIGDYIKTSSAKINSKLFFYAGGKESDKMVPDMKKIESDLKALSPSKIYEEVDSEAKHNEAAWRKYFPDFYKLVIQQ
jgi:predicted alpha/beta superfamily hydrolase